MASSSSSAMTLSDNEAGRHILRTVILGAPSKLLLSVLAEELTGAQVEELREKKKQEAMTSFNSLPDEIVIRIVKMAAVKREFCVWEEEKYNHDFLVDVLCRVSLRFRRLARESSLWKGCVVIHPGVCPKKAEFVVEECLNSGTTTFDMIGYHKGLHAIRDVDPTIRFPNLKLAVLGSTFKTYHRHDAGSDDDDDDYDEEEEEDEEDDYGR